MPHFPSRYDRENASSTSNHQIRVINIYETAYNLMLKYFWPKHATKHAVIEKTINENQLGGIPGGSADLVALINEFITEIHRLTFRYLVILQNNTKSYFAESSMIILLSTAAALKFQIKCVRST